MLNNLFKPAWQSNSAEKRLRAIATMDGSSAEKQLILAQLAKNDIESAIQISAINKLTSVITLHELSMTAGESVRVEAVNRLNTLLGENGSLQQQDFIELIARYPELCFRIASQALVPSVREEALRKVPAEQLLEVLELTTYTDSRQQIAERISTIEILESARKILRGKDKNAERIVKAKIDDIRKLERQQAENLSIVEKLIDEAEYLASHDWVSEFKAKILAHRSHWDKLDFEIDEALKQRYKIAREVIDSRFEEQKVIDETHESQDILIVELEKFVSEVANMDLASSITHLSETNNRRTQLETSWQALTVKARPNLIKDEFFDKKLRALQSANELYTKAVDILRLEEEVAKPDEVAETGQASTVSPRFDGEKELAAALKQLKWPAQFAALKSVNELQSKLVSWQNARKVSAAEYKQSVDLVHKKIGSIFHFSRTGNLMRAKQFYERAEKSLTHFNAKDCSILEERLVEARQALDKMGDWKNFATEPKYLELCDEMELLASSKHHPDKLSKEIKALQQRWKILGHSDVSDQYWSRFKQAADKVYQPCADFFDKRHKTRKDNLQQRQQVVNQMRELLELTDWDNSPDYKAVQSSLRTFAESFSKIKEVEHGAGQKQWTVFSKLKDDVYDKLNVAYEANILLKQELIKKATSLAETVAKKENLTALKILQTRWKQVGVTRRNADQKAWKEFNRQGDIVYHNVQQLRQGERDETDLQLNAYRNIIKEIKLLAKNANNLAEADQQFTQLQQQYNNLPALPDKLPEKLLEGIERDYRHACDQFDNSHSRIIDTMHNRQIEALRNKAKLCVQLEALDGSSSDKKLQEISQLWDAIELKNPALNRRIEKRRKSAADHLDRVDITAQRRLLCIQLEIIKGVESPAEAKSLRMQYQLDQMNERGLGQQSDNSAEQLEKMELDWLCMPGAEAEQQHSLDERFNRVLRSS